VAARVIPLKLEVDQIQMQRGARIRKPPMTSESRSRHHFWRRH